VPAEEAREHGGDAEIDEVVGGGEGALDEHGEDDNLERIGEDGQDQCGPKAGRWRDGDGIASHWMKTILIFARARTNRPTRLFYGGHGA